MLCPDCSPSRVNGVLVHEAGCPRERDNAPVTCFICGFDFIPEDPIRSPFARSVAVCPDCAAPADD